MTVLALTPRQQRFVAEYLIDLNATQAATRAGYSARTANQQASRLLANVNIQAAIAAGQAERGRRTEITADRVLAELGKLGFANMLDYMQPGPGGDPTLDFTSLTRDQAAALQEVTVEDYVDGRGEDARDVKRVKFRLADKRAALVDIGRHLGMFKDRVEHTGKDGAELVPRETAPGRLALAILALLPKPVPDASGGEAHDTETPPDAPE